MLTDSKMFRAAHRVAGVMNLLQAVLWVAAVVLVFTSAPHAATAPAGAALTAPAPSANGTAQGALDKIA